MDDIKARIARLYAAVGETVDDDIAGVAAKPFEREGESGWAFDFKGDLTDEQIANQALAAIDHVAHLRDHLGAWARQNGKDTERVQDTIRGSSDLATVVDLSNGWKHGYPLRKPWSGTQPRLTGFSRGLALGSLGGQGTIEISPAPHGKLSMHTTGTSTARIMVTASVQDADGTRLGDLATILEAAVRAWESLLSEWNLL